MPEDILHKFRRNQLATLIREVCYLLGGTGCDMSVDDYVQEQLRRWGDTSQRVQQAISCFLDIKNQVKKRETKQKIVPHETLRG